MIYSFNAKIAGIYGVNEAIFIHNLYWWTTKNEANGQHLHHGRYWTYNSMEAFGKLFPFWTVRQLRTVISKLEKAGAVLAANYNSKGFDKTKWYALSEEILGIYRGEEGVAADQTSKLHVTDTADGCDQTSKLHVTDTADGCDQTSKLHVTDTADGCDQTAQSICPKRQMDMTELPYASDQNDRPIPDSKPDINTDINTDSKPVSKREKRTRGVSVFASPTIEEITEYCKQRGNSIDPKRFLDYFEAADWKDSRGQPVQNWKQKIITWERMGQDGKGDKLHANREATKGNATGSEGKDGGWGITTQRL